jgi:peptidylprolyl isomerase
MRRTIICLLVLISPLFCDEEKNTDVAKLSEAMGHLIGKNLQSIGLPIDINALVRGMKDGCEGKEPPLSEDECVQALAALQEETLSLQSEKNLAEANEFLARNLKQKGIISLENGKVQYQIDKAGTGNAVQPYNSPVVRYKARYLNGETFGSSSGEEVISLDETIAGFSKGIIGMQEGEVRTLYIHPDLGYGRHGLSMPNALLVFEVELIKADASAEAQAASMAEDAIESSLNDSTVR